MKYLDSDHTTSIVSSAHRHKSLSYRIRESNSMSLLEKSSTLPTEYKKPPIVINDSSLKKTSNMSSTSKDKIEKHLSFKVDSKTLSSDSNPPNKPKLVSSTNDMNELIRFMKDSNASDLNKVNKSDGNTIAKNDSIVNKSILSDIKLETPILDSDTAKNNAETSDNNTIKSDNLYKRETADSASSVYSESNRTIKTKTSSKQYLTLDSHERYRQRKLTLEIVDKNTDLPVSVYLSCLFRYIYIYIYIYIF